jgi:hypothetical protein
VLPKGWRNFFLQLAIFASFDVVYEWSRSLAYGRSAIAFAHAKDIVQTERALGIFDELHLQAWVLQAPGIVLDVANWTYFNCQFTITIGFLLWVYCRRNDSFAFLRNVILAADFIGVVGYIAFPTAPPRMLRGLGFVDTLDRTGINHHSSAIASFSNPYAAMPSLHTAYALLIGTSGVLLARHLWSKALWSLYPGLVVFSIVATANHFILDAFAGTLTLLLALLMVTSVMWLRRRSSSRQHRRPQPPQRRRDRFATAAF